MGRRVIGSVVEAGLEKLSKSNSIEGEQMSCFRCAPDQVKVYVNAGGSLLNLLKISENVHSPSSIFIHFRPHSSIFIHRHPFSSISSTFIYGHHRIFACHSHINEVFTRVTSVKLANVHPRSSRNFICLICLDSFLWWCTLAVLQWQTNLILSEFEQKIQHGLFKRGVSIILTNRHWQHFEFKGSLVGSPPAKF